MWMYLAAFLGALVVSIGAQNPSPCPELFQYISQQPGQWDGDLTFFSDSDLHGVWLRLIFDSPSKHLTVANNFSEIVSRGQGQFLLRNKDYTLKAGEPVKVRIFAKYDGDKVPKLIGFRLNARTLCPQHDITTTSPPMPLYTNADPINKDALVAISGSRSGK